MQCQQMLRATKQYRLPTSANCPPSLQGIGLLVDRAVMLCMLLNNASAALSVVLAGSSLPETALQLAARLDRTSGSQAAARVGRS